jgi:hypothetical protein
VRGHAKATSARSTEGAAKGRGPKLAFLVGAALLASLVLGVTLGSAAIPTVSVQNAGEVGYTTAKVAGTVDPQGQFTTYRFQYISEAQFQDNLTNSLPGFEGAPTGVEAGTETAEGVSGELTGLNPDTVYHLRLAAENGDGPAEAIAAATFETLEVEDPIVSIDPVTTFTGTTAHFSGTVDPNAPSGSLDAATKAAYKTRWDFQCSPECPNVKGGFVEAEEGSKGVVADASGLEPNTSYEVKLLVSNASGPQSDGPVSFQTAAVGPGAETMPAFALGNGTEALVGGRVNPKNAETTYWIEYGTTTAYGTSTPASSAGSGSEAKILTQKISGLTPGTTYHFRLVAENATDEISGQDVSFESTPPAPAESCSNNTLRSENNSTELPDCRAYEQVSPVDKNGYDVGLQGVPVYVAAEDGSALSFEAYGGFADAVGASIINTYLSRRGDGGWWTHALGPPITPSATGIFTSFKYFSPDLSEAIMSLPSGPPLAPGATPDAQNLYLRDNSTDTYRTLNIGGSGEFSFAAASADDKHILFESSAPLTPDAPPGALRYLYEWSDGQLELVPIAPDGTPIPAGGWIEAAALNYATTHAISEDGSRVVFKSLEGEQVGQLFLREDGQRTIEVSASHRSTPDPGGPGFVHFVGASADTSQIFFFSTEALTEDAALGGVQSLYRYDANTETLTDLTANPLAGLALVEGVAAISEDGSDVYFYSKGQFVAGEGDPGQSNLYHSHNGTISVVAANTAGGDGPTWATTTTHRLSPNGRYLTFATEARVTAYDNTDAVTGAADGEVYRYDAVSKRLTCLSCNPDGQAPHGASGFTGPPAGFLRNQQPGASDEGNMFFNSSDALVANDVNGKGDVYEWKDGRPYLISSGSSGDPSLYASGSKNGDDVFFTTREQLIPADRDQILDLYDARVGGGFPRPVQISPCEGAEACHGPASSGPAFADPASGSISGAAQLSPSARRLQAARKACKKKPKKARAKCTANAKKHFTKAGRAH